MKFINNNMTELYIDRTNRLYLMRKHRLLFIDRDLYDRMDSYIYLIARETKYYERNNNEI